MTSMELTNSTTIDCMAIAYTWLVAPIDIEDYDVALIVSSFRTVFDFRSPIEDLNNRWKRGETNTIVYHAKLPPRESTMRLSDVSGTLGLLWSASDKSGESKASAFE